MTQRPDRTYLRFRPQLDSIPSGTLVTVLTLLTALTALIGLTGCGGPPAAEDLQPVTARPQPRSGPNVMEVTAIEPLKPGEYNIRVPKRSLTALERVESALLKAGWEVAKPKSPTGSGQRSWFGTGLKIGPTDAYDAAWTDPKSGRIARLTLAHMAEHPDLQHVSLEFFDAVESPL